MIRAGNILEPGDIVEVVFRPGFVILTMWTTRPLDSSSEPSVFVFTDEAAHKLREQLGGETKRRY